MLGSVDYPAQQRRLLLLPVAGAELEGEGDRAGECPAPTLINAIKQAAEFGIVAGGQRLAGTLVFISDVHSLGLKTAQGLVLTSAFYWDQNDETRAWSKRFLAETHKIPTMAQAGVYGAVTHQSRKAIAAAGTDDGPKVIARWCELPINDFMTKNGWLREDGRVMRDMYLFQVKSPESKYEYDYYKELAVIPAEEAFRPLNESTCPHLGAVVRHQRAAHVRRC